MKQPSDASIIILAAARNVAHILESQVEVLNKSFRDFKEVRFYFVESHSTDSTLVILKNIEAKYKNFRFESISSISDPSKTRTERISLARNKAMQYAANFSDSLDYVVVADVDGVNSGLTRSSVISNWSNSEWDMVAANQRRDYYDVWALRLKDVCPNDCWEDFENLCKITSEKTAFILSVKSKMKSFIGTQGFVRVDSAFGGIAIYKSSIYFDSEYRGMSEKGIPICEHVPFNSNLVENGARLFINPEFINSESSTSSLPVHKRIKHFLVGNRIIYNPRNI
jgi:glycosyltransferase involved in cell wall biosynthesis